jgi:hypothetical protein
MESPIPPPFQETLNPEAISPDEVMLTESLAIRAKQSVADATVAVRVNPRMLVSTTGRLLQRWRQPDLIGKFDVDEATAADSDRVVSHVHAIGPLFRCRELRLSRCDRPLDLVVQLLRTGVFVSLLRIVCDSPLDPETVAAELSKYSHICRNSGSKSWMFLELAHTGTEAPAETSRKIVCVNRNDDRLTEDYVQIVSIYL